MMTKVISLNIPIILAGDFNIIVDATKKKGRKPFQPNKDNREYVDFISTNGLVDLGWVILDLFIYGVIIDLAVLMFVNDWIEC